MKRFSSLIILLFVVQHVISQDVEFSQYYANVLYLNPAFAGSENMSRVSLNYRAQLPSSFGDYSTYSASYDQYFEGLNGGLGFQIMNDRQAQGAINDLNINLIYAYHIKFRRLWSMNFGIKAGYNIKSIHSGNLVLPDMIDENTLEIDQNNQTLIDNQINYFDFSAGFLSWFKDYYIGVSIDHLTKPILSLGSDDPGVINTKYTLHGGMEIPFFNSMGRTDMTLSPNVLVQLQGGSSKYNLGIYLNKNLLTTGIWLKTNSQFNLTGAVLMLGIIGDYSTFAYSYDIPFYLNGFTGIISGSHEVTFLYKFKYKNTRKKYKAIKCPKI